MLVVAVTAPWARGAKRGAVPARRRLVPALAAGAGRLVRMMLAVVLAVRGLAGVALVAYGAWLAWPPAGPIVVGVALLADRILDERPRREESPS